MYPKDPFRAAWDYYQQLQNIIPPNEQSFRHGWNAALMASAKKLEEARATFRPDILDPPGLVRTLEVEVKT